MCCKPGENQWSPLLLHPFTSFFESYSTQVINNAHTSVLSGGKLGSTTTQWNQESEDYIASNDHYTSFTKCFYSRKQGRKETTLVQFQYRGHFFYIYINSSSQSFESEMLKDWAPPPNVWNCFTPQELLVHGLIAMQEENKWWSSIRNGYSDCARACFHVLLNELQKFLSHRSLFPCRGSKYQYV